MKGLSGLRKRHPNKEIVAALKALGAAGGTVEEAKGRSPRDHAREFVRKADGCLIKDDGDGE